MKEEIVACVVAASNIETEYKESFEILVRDMTENLLVGYISPGYYPIILGYFISSGMSGIMKLAVAILQ